MRYLLFLISALIVFISCQPASNKPTKIKVEYKGALKNFMRKGDISAQADLKELKNIKHLYALGAVENLKGEILILDSKPFISMPNEDSYSIKSTYDLKTTLLVYASVEKWKSYEIPSEIISYQDFEAYVEKVAAKNGINTEQPFPFMIEGMIKSAQWHVIKWPEGDSVHTHKKHQTVGPHGRIENRDVDILGFYSKHHHAIFTHHATNMHLHVKTKDNKLSGHLDGMTLGEGMILKLPQ
jgi:hypothetical protein